jgi:hypothetical protein
VRHLSEGIHGAASWEHERRVVYKAEAMEKEAKTRFQKKPEGRVELLCSKHVLLMRRFAPVGLIPHVMRNPVDRLW